MEQLTDKELEALSRPHLNCVLLVDTSAFMAGEPIEAVNKALSRFQREVLLSKEISEQMTIDVALITFDSVIRSVLPFMPAGQLRTPEFSAGGESVLGAAVSLAIDKLMERRRFHHGMGDVVLSPCIFLISRGEPTDDIIDAVNHLREKRFEFWSLTPPGANMSILRLFSQNIVRLEDDFSCITNKLWHIWDCFMDRAVVSDLHSDTALQQAIELPTNIIW